LPQEARNYALANPDMSPEDVVMNLAAKGITATAKQISNFRYGLAKKEEGQTKAGRPRKAPKAPKMRKIRRERKSVAKSTKEVIVNVSWQKVGSGNAAILSAVEALGSVEEELVSKLEAVRDMRARLRGMAA